MTSSFVICQPWDDVKLVVQPPVVLPSFMLTFQSFAAITLPPSRVIVAPFTYEPARLLKNKHAPATSSGVPIRPSGMLASIVSRCASKVAAIILLSNGPQAKEFDLRVVPGQPKRRR
ncbi:similar to An08g00660 [Aspergillus luchuensis]|uniref:Similar to An08g00660 n=1 Tax=Aspergillus kawachii TaxID=1069201 RepID=A0A146FMM0_ASPKA|nr:similar to An08g00660 [Aspergillus luchuensis]